MGTLVCTIEMDKNGGVTVTIDNEDGKITQTVKMDGTIIELKVKGESATSTITQSAEKVSVVCKQFEVKAEETVQISSGKASTYKSGDTTLIQSAKDMTVKSDADIKASAMNVAVTGKTEVKLTGGSTSKATLAAAGATLAGTKVSLEGQAQLAGKAPMVEVKSDGMMTLESSGVATLKGALTNVQGNLVNLG